MSHQKYIVLCLALIAGSALAHVQVKAETNIVDKGAALYVANCETCHGPNGDGNGVAAESMILKPRDFALAAFKFDTDADWRRGTDADLRNVITQGTAVFGGSAVMPAWNHLTTEEVKNLIAYIRSLQKSR